MSTMNEFAIEWIKGNTHATVTVPSGTALKTKLLKLAKKRPDDVTVSVVNADGSVVVKVPVSYVKISEPKKVSDERKEAMSKRSKDMWEARKKSEDIKKGDYIEGYEVVGPEGFTRKKKMRIIVDTITKYDGHTMYHGQADDEFNGARGGVISTKYGEVKKLDCEPFSEFWWRKANKKRHA